MKYHAIHYGAIYSTQESGEYACLFGVAGGRVRYPYSYREGDAQGIPDEKGWLYSLRVMLLLWKVEVLWRTRG